ncbi:fimbrial protein [Pseudocitrobacter corydidari]
MKKTLLAATLVMASGSALAIDGQIDFYGRVDPGTCETHIVNKDGTSVSGDGEVRLATAQITDITATRVTDQVGARDTSFTISAKCDGANLLKMTMSSPTYAATDGTLKNNTNITVNGEAAAGNVNIAVHEVKDTGGYDLVEMNNASDVVSRTAVAGGYTNFNFKASYVRAEASAAVTSGHVTTNALYTVAYE